MERNLSKIGSASTCETSRNLLTVRVPRAAVNAGVQRLFMGSSARAYRVCAMGGVSKLMPYCEVVASLGGHLSPLDV